MDRLLLRAVLVSSLLGGLAAKAQFMKSLVNTNAVVTWTHPPALGIPARRVAFAPVPGAEEAALVSDCSARLAGKVEVVDRERVAAAFRNLKLDPAGPLDEAGLRALGTALGGPVLLTLRIQVLRTDRTRRTLYPQPQTLQGSLGPGGFHLARTEVSLRATLQAADTATGRTFPTRTVTAPESPLFRQAAAECEHAKALREQGPLNSPTPPASP